MTDKQIIDCEYLETGEIKFCNALNVSFYSDFLCNKGNCIILKLEQQLKRAEQKLAKIKDFLIKNVCLEDEICLFCDNQDCINKDVIKIIEGKENE